MLRGETPNMAYKCVPQVRLPKWVVGGRCSGGVEGVVWMVSGQVGLAGPEFRETLHKAFVLVVIILSSFSQFCIQGIIRCIL